MWSETLKTFDPQKAMREALKQCHDAGCCETYKYNDMKPEDTGNPCWNCKGDDNPEWERKDGE